MMMGHSFVGRIFRNAPVHAWAADLRQEVDATRRVRERLLILGHHGILNGSRRNITERRSSTRKMLSTSAGIRMATFSNLHSTHTYTAGLLTMLET